MKSVVDDVAVAFAEDEKGDGGKNNDEADEDKSKLRIGFGGCGRFI